jgi:hypothetical protein
MWGFFGLLFILSLLAARRICQAAFFPTQIKDYG